jgi:acetyltransferase-like isoleucine patch superfamily enzyme
MSSYRFTVLGIYHLWIKRFQLQKYKLRILGASVGKNNTFNGWLVVVGDFANLRIGDGNVFNQNIILNLNSKISIGNRNHFSSGVKITTTKLNKELTEHVSFPVTIGNNNWLATDSLIAVSLGEISVPSGVTLGAKSLLNKSALIPGLYLGVPANPKSFSTKRD